jgi:hypothetical protein
MPSARGELEICDLDNHYLPPRPFATRASVAIVRTFVLG